MNKDDDDESLLRMQNQAIDENDEVHEDIIDELEDMYDEDDSAQTLKIVTQKLEVRI